MLSYIFDPLCGWCYASAPALHGLVQRRPGHVAMMPSGLFAGEGARELSPEFARHAWANDRRIASMTGQVFSETYRQDILEKGSVRFDSTYLNRALTLAHATDATLEPRLLTRLQHARYVDGKDTSRADVVASIAAPILSEPGDFLSETELHKRLTEDGGLAQKTLGRIEDTRTLMRKLGVRGVPQLLLNLDGKTQALPSEALYQGPDALIMEIDRRIAGHAA